MMMMVILIVDGDDDGRHIEMMVEKQAVLVVHMEVDNVTKELGKMDQEQDEGLERAPMMMMVKVGIDGRHWDGGWQAGRQEDAVGER